VTVVGAVIVVAGRVLGARRSAPALLAGQWEFPGGKVEAGESDADALIRECREELGITIEVIGELCRIVGTMELRLLHARLTAGRPAPLQDHDQLRWLSATELDSVPWLPLDLELLPVVRALLIGEPMIGSD
jgi:8-oxo-dGTP diphosphatase